MATRTGMHSVSQSAGGTKGEIQARAVTIGGPQTLVLRAVSLTRSTGNTTPSQPTWAALIPQAKWWSGCQNTIADENRLVGFVDRHDRTLVAFKFDHLLRFGRGAGLEG
jgi:hypothetical protein